MLASRITKPTLRPRVFSSMAAASPRVVVLAPDSYAAQPTHGVVLAAGLGSRLRPFTDSLPKAFVPVAGKPMVAHSLASLRSVGMETSTIVTGYGADVFAARKDELGDGVTLVQNQHYDSTEMLMSFFQSSRNWDPKSDGLYMTYSDIVYTKKLQEAKGDICIVVDRDFRRGGGARPNHPFSQVEAVGIDPALGPSGGVKAIGKGSCGTSADEDVVYGEFIGLMKVSAKGREILQESMHQMGIEVQPDGQVKHHKFGVELLGTPLVEAFIADLLQHLIVQGVHVTPVPIFGNWREVDTSYDLMRANNSMSYLNDQAGQRNLVAQMGAQLLSEANDLKREGHQSSVRVFL